MCTLHLFSAELIGNSFFLLPRDNPGLPSLFLCHTFQIKMPQRLQIVKHQLQERKRWSEGSTFFYGEDGLLPVDNVVLKPQDWRPGPILHTHTHTQERSKPSSFITFPTPSFPSSLLSYTPARLRDLKRESRDSKVERLLFDRNNRCRHGSTSTDFSVVTWVNSHTHTHHTRESKRALTPSFPPTPPPPQIIRT